MITKLPLPDAYIQEISLIAKEMEKQGNVFSFSISLPCISEKSLQKYEPKVPSPERRMKTLQNVYNAGIPTMVAIRPLLPDLEDGEIDAIIDATKDFTIGYYSGPLYLKQDTAKVLLPDFKIEEEEKQPHWMLDGNSYQEVIKDGQLESLISLVKKSGRQFFDGAATGIEYLRKMKKYDQPRN